MSCSASAARRGLGAVAMVALVAVLGCRPAVVPAPEAGASAMLVASALAQEAEDDLAADAYVEALRRASLAPGDPWSGAAAAAALDALVGRRVVGGPRAEHAIVHRSARRLAQVTVALRRMHPDATQPWVKTQIALALAQLAHRVGAPTAAERWRWRAGCLHQVALSGPWGAPPLTALARGGPVASRGVMPARWTAAGAFPRGARFESVATDRGRLDLGPSGDVEGVRSAVVDLPAEAPRTLLLVLASTAAAEVEIGGAVALRRPFADGPARTEHAVRVELEPGRARIVVRVADRGDADEVMLRVFDAQGDPVTTFVPRPGGEAEAAVQAIVAVPVAPPRAEYPTVWAAALLAAGHARRVVAADRAAGSVGPLQRARALLEARQDTASALTSELAEEARRAREVCPGCWEAHLLEAEVARRRHGATTGTIAALGALEVTVDEMPARSRVELARIVELAAAATMPDVARGAFRALRKRERRAALVAEADAVLFHRLGADGVRAACEGGLRRDGMDCYRARLDSGDWQGAMLELGRLRRLRGSQGILRRTELEMLVAQGDVERATALFRALPPAQRPLAALGLLAGREEGPLDAELLTPGVLAQAVDAPRSAWPALQVLGVVEPSGPVDAAAVVASDRRSPFAEGAAIAILERSERYHLDASGLLQIVLHDVRRLGGTTDVARGTWVGTPSVEGRVAGHWRWRRVFKADGRVLDADPEARGAQTDTELTQLAPGDYVESLYVAFALPTASGQLVVDGADVLPPRTSLRHGYVELRRPRDLPLSTWQHVRLGAPRREPRPGEVVDTWDVVAATPRGRETGVPPLEARVGLSFGTDRYERLGSALAERFASLTEGDRRVANWARSVSTGAADPEDALARLVTASGRALRRSDPVALSDFVANLDLGPQRSTASTMLTRGRGSRTWLLHRALAALGIESEVVVSETVPFAGADGFPPRAGRFSRPLLVVRGAEDVWVDADVDGPPLPPGQISPELRGRTALRADGTFLTVPEGASATPAQVRIALTVDREGDARGELTATLRGMDAQRVLDELARAVGAERDAILRDVIRAWEPRAEVTEVRLQSSRDALPIEVAASIEVPGFAQPSTTNVWSIPGTEPIHRVRPRPRVATLASRYAGLTDRREALRIPEPTLYVLERHLTLPPGGRWLARPADWSIQRPFAEAERRLTQDGSILRERFRLDLPAGTVSPEVFATFAEDAKTIDDAFRHSIRIELP